MLKLQELLGTRPCAPDICETLCHPVSPRVSHCRQAHTAALTLNSVFNIPTNITASRSSTLSQIILYIFWFAQTATSRMLTLPAQACWVAPAPTGVHGLPLKHSILILKLLWWLGKWCINWDQCIYQSSALCERAADVSGYQRTDLCKTQGKDLWKTCLNTCPAQIQD